MKLNVFMLPAGSLQSGARRRFVVPMLLALLVLTFSSTTQNGYPKRRCPPNVSGSVSASPSSLKTRRSTSLVSNSRS